MKKNLLLLSIISFCFSPVFSQVLYSNTNQEGRYFTTGSGTAGTPRIIFDDVLIPSTQVQGSDSISITKLNFGIYRGPLAPAATVKIYYTIIEDTATMFGTLIRIPPVLLGSVNFPANGATATDVLLTLGDSVNRLFAVKTDTGNLYYNYQAFFVGLSFSDTSHLTGWELTIPGAPESDNANVLWVYDADRAPSRFATNFPGGTPTASFYVQAFGKGVTTPLPVTMTNFNARRYGRVNELNWVTENELNAHYFVIERSNNGSSYTGIGRVDASGTSTVTHNYAFIDLSPAPGNNYYRIRTVDKDNSFKLSLIRSIRNLGLADINIYPNPATDRLTVDITADHATAGNLVITDVSGKTVFSKTVKLPGGNSVIPVPVSNIATGAYIIRIQLEDDVIIKQFNKH